MYPVRARVVNVRDRSVQWVTVAYIPHVGKAVARTAAARLRASATRNGVLQRCLAVLLRRFVCASQVGVQVLFPGQRVLTAVPRLIGLVADQLRERSVFCFMGSTCEFFCSHCVVRRDVAGGPDGVGAAARDVTAVLDAQLEGAITRDGDPRPSLRGHLRTEHSALAFVPAVGAIWGLATDNKRLRDITSFDLLMCGSWASCVCWRSASRPSCGSPVPVKTHALVLCRRRWRPSIYENGMWGTFAFLPRHHPGTCSRFSFACFFRPHVALGGAHPLTLALLPVVG